jgi:hypothetical protein
MIMDKEPLDNHIRWFRCTYCRQPLNPFEPLPPNCPEHERLIAALQESMAKIGQAFW